jgi:hypothetical protein
MPRSEQGPRYFLALARVFELCIVIMSAVCCAGNNICVCSELMSSPQGMHSS